MRRAIAGLALIGLLGTAAAGPVARFSHFSYEDRPMAPVAAGRYRNPILPGFYPDPSVTRVGDDYYLVNSTFAFFPGLPIFKSRDLVNWHQIGNAVDRPGMVDFGKLGLSRGLFAPDISFHDGVFYILNTCIDCGGNFLITATEPAGPWSDPVWLAFDGIDPSLFVDDDGTAWILNNDVPEGGSTYDGHRAIWIQRFDLATKKMVGPRTQLINGGVHFDQKPIWAEGPHLFRKDGFYYLTTAEGGTAEDHSQVIWRAEKVTGPYTPGPVNPILTQRDLDPARPAAVTSAGHADFVTARDGGWWATFLATRPYKGDHYNLGRETFLLPVTWKNGWPMILPAGERIPMTPARPDLEPDTSPASAPEWLTLRGPADGWLTLGDDIALEARPVALGGLGRPSFIGRRLIDHFATIETALDFAPEKDGDRAGLAILQGDDHFFVLERARVDGRDVVRLERRAGTGDPVDGVPVASAPVAGGTLKLRIVARGAAYDFLYAEGNGDWKPLAMDQDGTILSTKTAGGFVGAVVGPFARAGD